MRKRKLSLARETVRSLDHRDFRIFDVQGGLPTQVCTYGTCGTLTTHISCVVDCTSN
ncbi:MAG TPA: hypothetical protein VN783_11775 [Thermoanaerobaculia bacterium]|nr:hypothetical protein [Thermoanaerobaculia bacterium]